MTSLIFFVIVIALGYFFREKLAFLILQFFKKGPKRNDQNVSETVFSPAGTVRSFPIIIDLEEVGDGTVKISIKK